MKNFIKYFMTVFVFTYCISCSDKENKPVISEIKYNWTPIEMVTKGSLCNEYYLNGEKNRIDCYHENDPSFLETFMEFKRDGERVKEIIYKSSLTRDTIFLYLQNNNYCLVSDDAKWEICYDSAFRNIRCVYLNDNYMYLQLANFRKYIYDKSGLVKSMLILEGESDLMFSRYYYNYIKFDPQGNWIEREVYSDFEYIDDDEGFKVNQLTEDERNKLFNTFPSGPEELNDKEPFIQTRTIVYE